MTRGRKGRPARSQFKTDGRAKGCGTRVSYDRFGVERKREKFDRPARALVSLLSAPASPGSRVCSTMLPAPHLCPRPTPPTRSPRRHRTRHPRLPTAAATTVVFLARVSLRCRPMRRVRQTRRMSSRTSSTSFSSPGSSALTQVLTTRCPCPIWKA